MAQRRPGLLPVDARAGARPHAGFFFAAVHLSGGLTPVLVAAMPGWLSCRSIFLVCGAVGFVWASAWFRWFRDEPRDHPGVDAEEVALIESGRVLTRHGRSGRRLWRVLATSPNVWFLCLAYLSNATAHIL